MDAPPEPTAKTRPTRTPAELRDALAKLCGAHADRLFYLPRDAGTVS